MHTSVHSFRLSFICCILALHPGVGTLKVLRLQQSIKDIYSAPAVHIFWFFPYSLKISLVLVFSEKAHLPEITALACSMRLFEEELLLWLGEPSWWQATLGSRSATALIPQLCSSTWHQANDVFQKMTQKIPHLQRSPGNISLCLWP